jgi:hypothetical protein
MAQKISGTTVAVGVGVAAAAAAAAGGAYWLYGSKHSAKHRKMAKSWMLKARAEVMDAIEKLDDVDKERYIEIVEGVLKNYAKIGATPQELATMMRDFKGAWTHMQGSKKPAKKKAKKQARSGSMGTKKAAKKRSSKK